MTDAQSNNLDMYIVVNDFYTRNQAAIDTVPALTTAFGYLAGQVSDINGQISGQSTDTTGVAQDKTALRNTLNTISLSILAPAKAWALANGNNTLAAEFDYSMSELQAIKDDTMEGFCTLRIGLVNDNIATMADYGILPPQTLEWQAALDAYVSVLASPREAINARHLHTENLKVHFTETGRIFRSLLDPLMVPFKTTDTQLYNAYKQARIVINRKGQTDPAPPNTDTASLFGVVTDSATLSPIENANLFIGAATPPQVTDLAGNYLFDQLAASEYTLTVEAVGYEPLEQQVIIEEAAQVELNIQLVPIPVVP